MVAVNPVTLVLHRPHASASSELTETNRGPGSGISLRVPNRPPPKTKLTRFEQVTPDEKASIMAELRKQVAEVSAPDTRDQPRLSNVRYTQNVRAGKHKHTMKLLGAIRAAKGRNVTIEEAVHHLSSGILTDRQRLDILRQRATKAKAKQAPLRLNNKLPTYYSPLYRRRYYFREDDLHEVSCRGTGPGGQATNRRAQTSIVTHKPTGITVKCHKFPSLHNNRRVTRMKLHLELERHLLGEDSLLARREAALRHKGIAAAKRASRLERAGKALLKKAAHYFDVLPFLSGHVSLPLDAVAPTSKGISVRGALEALCMCWWECINLSFRRHWASPQTVESTIFGVDGSSCERVRGWVIGASKYVPCWYCFFFPLVPRRPQPAESPPQSLVELASRPVPALTAPPQSPQPDVAPTSDPEMALVVQERTQSVEEALAIVQAKEELQKLQQACRAARLLVQTVDYHQEQVTRCVFNDEARANVCRALRGVLEAFGLRTNCEEVEAVQPPGAPIVPLRVSQDAVLWAAHKDRLYCQRTGKVTEVAAAVLPHTLASLSAMGMSTEFHATMAFLEMKGRPNPAKGKKGAPWARELITKTNDLLNAASNRGRIVPRSG